MTEEVVKEEFEIIRLFDSNGVFIEDFKPPKYIMDRIKMRAIDEGITNEEALARSIREGLELLEKDSENHTSVEYAGNNFAELVFIDDKTE